MSRKFTISQFRKLNNDFLDVESPNKLAEILGIKTSVLIKNIKYQRYTSFTSIHKGKKRIVAEPNFELKQIQRRLNNYLQAIYYFNKHENVHGFVKCVTNEKIRYSILSNALPHVGKSYVINADIFRFFPSITGKMVKDVFLGEPFFFEDNLASALALLCIQKNWLPTGAPTSPVISNLVCMELDEELNVLANKNNYSYTRYADDMTFSGENKPDEKFKDELTSILESFGFKLHKKKYRVLTKHTRQTVTGIVVNEKLNVKREYKRNLRALHHDIKVNGIENALLKNRSVQILTIQGIESFKNSTLSKSLFVDKVAEYSKAISNAGNIDGEVEYLLFADLELDGFIIDVFDNHKQAVKKMHELWHFIASLWTLSHNDIVGKISAISQKRYRLTEETRYETIGLEGCSNGFYTVGVVKLNNKFTQEEYEKKRGRIR